METSILKEVSPVDQIYDKEEQSGFDSISQVALLIPILILLEPKSYIVFPLASFIGQYAINPLSFPIIPEQK